MPTVKIRNLVTSDRPAWEILWSNYLEFYETSLPVSMFNLAFERLISPDENEYTGLIALLSGEAVGIAHTLKHRHGWKEQKVIYLQDLFVSESARGSGVARELIAEIYRRADSEGTPDVYWLTATTNSTARRLYDKIAVDSGLIQYTRY